MTGRPRVNRKWLWGTAGAATSGLLARATLHPFDLPWCALVCLVPVLLTTYDATRLERGLLLFAFGVVANVLGFSFIPDSLATVTGLPRPTGWLVLGALAAVQSLHFILAGLACPPGPDGAKWLVVSIPAAEGLRVGPFPWFLGTLLQGEPVLAQSAAFGGMMTLTLVLTGANLLVARGLAKQSLAPLTWALALVTLVAAGGWLRVQRIDSNRPTEQNILQVAVVHGHFSHAELHLSNPGEVYARVTREILASPSVKGSSVDLVVWPESAFIDAQTQAQTETALRMVRSEAAHRRSPPLLLGATVRAGSDVTNSALLLDRWGNVTHRYDKRKLIAGGEAPLVLGPFHIPTPARFRAGSTGPDFEVAGVPIAVPICVEDMYPSLLEDDLRAHQASLLISLTSDAWFSGELGAELHFQLSRLRAIELGLPLLRVTNRGVTSLVLPTGKVATRLPTGHTNAAVVPVPLLSAPTWTMPISRRQLALGLLVVACILWVIRTGYLHVIATRSQST